MSCYFLMLYFCSWEMAGIYKSRKIINANHSLGGEPRTLNETVYKRTQQNNLRPLSSGSGVRGISLARKRLHSKYFLLSTDHGMSSTAQQSAVFKDSLNELCVTPQAADAGFNMRPVRVLDTSASFHVTLAWRTRSSCLLSAELSINYRKYRNAALRKIFKGHAVTSPVSCSTIWKCHSPALSPSPYDPYPSSFPNLW